MDLRPEESSSHATTVANTTIDKFSSSSSHNNERNNNVNSSSNNSGTTTTTDQDWLRQGERRALQMRLIFVASILCAAGLVGGLAFYFTKRMEEDTAEQTYESIASLALREARAIMQRKQASSDVLQSIYSFAFPDLAQWPNVGLSGFVTIASKMAAVSGIGAVVVSPKGSVACASAPSL